MDGRGGKRAGAGRKKGSVTRRTQKIREALSASGELPLDFMLRVMRDETAELRDRLDMAKSAAPYVHPRRAPEGAPDERQTQAGVRIVDESTP